MRVAFIIFQRHLFARHQIITLIRIRFYIATEQETSFVDSLRVSEHRFHHETPFSRCAGKALVVISHTERFVCVSGSTQRPPRGATCSTRHTSSLNSVYVASHNSQLSLKVGQSPSANEALGAYGAVQRDGCNVFNPGPDACFLVLLKEEAALIPDAGQCNKSLTSTLHECEVAAVFWLQTRILLFWKYSN